MRIIVLFLERQTCYLALGAQTLIPFALSNLNQLQIYFSRKLYIFDDFAVCAHLTLKVLKKKSLF